MSTKLEPLPAKVSTKLAKRLNKLRLSAGATKLQTLWRGHKSRLHIRDLIAQLKALSDSLDHGNELESFVDVPYSKLRSVQFCVDAAEGLPACCSATRVTAKLLSPTREMIGDSYTSVSSAAEDPHSPGFDLIGSWDKSLLSSAAYTFLVRVDTLERPSLRPRCVGYSVLKLCTDELHNRRQPAQDTDPMTDTVLFNSGLFRLPIYYGKLVGSTSHSLFSEASTLSQLDGALPGAHLYVRLFDSSIDKPTRYCADRGQTSTPGRGGLADPYRRTLDMPEGNVALVLAAAYHFADSTDTPPLFTPVTKPLLLSYLHRRGQLSSKTKGQDKGQQQEEWLLTEEDAICVHRAVDAWITAAFPVAVTQLIDPRFFTRYDDSSGVSLAVEGLYNMHESCDDCPTDAVSKYPACRQRLSNAEFVTLYKKAAMSRRRPQASDVARIDHTVPTFKAMVKYLRGSETPYVPPEGGGSSSSDSPSVGTKPRAEETRANLQTPNRGGGSPSTIIIATPQSGSPVTLPNPNPKASETAAGSPPGAPPHPDSVLDDVSAGIDFDRPVASPMYMDQPKLVSGMQLGPHACALVLITRVLLEVSAQGKVFVTVNYNSDAYSYWALVPLRMDSPLRRSLDCPEAYVALDEDNCFARFGTLQVPVFCGRCPPEVLNSARPYETLLELIKLQQSRQVARWSDRARDEWSLWRPLRTAAVAPADLTDPKEEAEQESGRSHVSLSNGVSIFVKVSDGRCGAFAAPHISYDMSQTLNDSLVKEITELYCYTTAYPSTANTRTRLLKHLRSIFAFDGYRFENAATTKSLLPSNVNTGRSLWGKVTDIYIRSVKEYHERLYETQQAEAQLEQSVHETPRA